MLTHDFARLLLSRRNNDLKFEVWIDDDPTGLEDETRHVIEMVDDRERVKSGGTVAPEHLVTYVAEGDYLLLHLGTIFLGDPDGQPPMKLSVEERAIIRKSLIKQLWSYDQVGMADDHPSKVALKAVLARFPSS
jgi:hypothetical protein